MNAPAHTLGVVVLSFGRDGLHHELIGQLCDAHGVPAESIIVVHNAYDRWDAWLPEVADGVRVIGTGDNLGYAGGMNIGIARHLSDGRSWILCLTHEVRLQEGCIDELLTAGAGRADIGIVGPVLRSPGTQQPWSTGIESIPGGVRHTVTLNPVASFIPRDAVDGSAMLLRGRAYRAIGGLDERMFMYWEETEFCLRVRTGGWSVGVAGSAVATAAPGGARRTAAHAYLTARNGLLYANQLGGRRAVRARLGRSARDTWRSIPKPGGRRFGQLAMWRLAAVQTGGTLLGTLDFARGRWGRPPELLLRGTDIRPRRD